jgi:hypothetical protein
MDISSRNQFLSAAAVLVGQHLQQLVLLVVVVVLAVAAVVLAKMVPLVAVVVMAQYLSGLGDL